MRAPVFLSFLLSLTVGNSQQIVTVTGMPHNHRADVDGVSALDAPLRNVYGVLRDRITGRILLHDETLVERIEPDGTLLAFAGISRPADGSTVDGTPSSNFAFGILRGMAQDASGAIYLSDAFTSRVLRIGTDGTITTFAGGGSSDSGKNHEGQPATSVPVGSPRGLVFDSKGNLLIAEVGCQCIRRVDTNGILTTLYSLPHTAPFLYAEGLAIDAADNVYATVYSGHTVLKIAPDGSANIIAGTGVPGFSGDGGPANVAQLNFPSGVAVAADGTLSIADTGNNRIRRITPDGMITTFAGTGERGFAGDGGPASSAKLYAPAQIFLDPDGTLYFSDYINGRIRRITRDGTIGTIAGGGNFVQSASSIGDGGPAINARLNSAMATATDSAGNIYVVDSSGYRIRKIAIDGTITTAAGNGDSQFHGDGGPATEAGLGYPLGIGVDSQNNIYITGEDARVRMVDHNGIITTVAGAGPGSGLIRYLGDGGPAINATLNEPKGVAVDAAGNIYIADTSNARLRMVDRNGIIHLIAAADTSLLGQDYWNAVAIDPQGRIYVASTHASPSAVWSLVSRVNPDGSLTTVAGTGQPCANTPILDFLYDGQPANKVPLCIVVGLTFDPLGNLYIPEPRYGALLKMTPDGTLTRIAGAAGATVPGDGGPALAASLAPLTVAIDGAGNLFVPQGSSSRVREITKTPVTLKLSSDHMDLQGSQSQTLGIAANFAEPFAYTVRIKTTEGGSWLAANRTSGQTGEPLKVASNPAGLAPGLYHGSITVTLLLPIPQAVDVPVTLTVAASN